MKEDALPKHKEVVPNTQKEHLAADEVSDEVGVSGGGILQVCGHEGGGTE